MATPWWFPRFLQFFSREKSRHWVAVVVWSKSRMDLRWGRNHFSGGLVGGFKHFLCSPLPGRWSNLTNLLKMGWNHHLVDYFEKKGGTLDCPFGTLLLVPSRERSHAPPKEKRKIIDSLVPWDGICYMFNMSPLKSYLGPNITGKEKVFLSLHFSESMLNFGGVLYIDLFVSSFVNKSDVVESPSDDGMNIIIKNMLSD